MSEHEEDFIKTGVIGYPITHSKSPIIHNYWIDRYGCAGSYEAIAIEPDTLQEGIADLIKKGFQGFNVTIPHKESIVPLCHEIDPLAEKVGAVNTVKIRNGLLYGFNTDVFGFIENLNKAVEQFGFSWGYENGPALIIGAGGAARAAVIGLLQENVPQILISNRTEAKAKDLHKLAPDRIKIVPWDKRSRAAGAANLIVNTTSLGMAGQKELEIDLTATPEETLVYDIVYNPLYTPLLKQAREHDLRVVTGIGMLLHQAAPAFELWYDVIPEVDETLTDKVLAA